MYETIWTFSGVSTPAWKIIHRNKQYDSRFNKLKLQAAYSQFTNIKILFKYTTYITNNNYNIN